MENKNQLEIGEYVLLANGEIVNVVNEIYSESHKTLMYACLSQSYCGPIHFIHQDDMSEVLTHSKTIDKLDTFTYRDIVRKYREKDAMKYLIHSLKRKICFWEK